MTGIAPSLSAEEREKKEQLIKAWREQKTAILNQGQSAMIARITECEWSIVWCVVFRVIGEAEIDVDQDKGCGFSFLSEGTALQWRVYYAHTHS